MPTTKRNRTKAAIAQRMADIENEASEAQRRWKALTPEERKAEAEQTIRDIWGD